MNNLMENKCLSLTEVNNCVDLTIRIFDSMAENHGLKFKEVNNACNNEQRILKNVKILYNKLILKINLS